MHFRLLIALLREDVSPPKAACSMAQHTISDMTHE
jgi:hypothetical protein